MNTPASQLLQKLKQQTQLSRDEITVLINDAVKQLGGTDKTLFAELEALATYIHNTKQEIAALQSGPVSSTHIPNATDELDAVVQSTADATNSIMNACDQIMEIAGTLPADTGQKLTNTVTSIYEACNFQDITGQRITKVVRALKHIEEQITRLVKIFGVVGGEKTNTQPATSTISLADEKSLLNGPQLPSQANNQADIDKLLADFDSPTAKK